MAEEKTILKVSSIVAILAFATVASIFGYAGLSGTSQFAYAQKQGQSFHAKLSGKDEVPPVNTQATGTAQFQLSSDGKEINYDLTTPNLNGFMMAHIHKGKAGENGQPITTPLQMGKGKITSSDLQGS